MKTTLRPHHDLSTHQPARWARRRETKAAVPHTPARWRPLAREEIAGTAKRVGGRSTGFAEVMLYGAASTARSTNATSDRAQDLRIDVASGPAVVNTAGSPTYSIVVTNEGPTIADLGIRAEAAGHPWVGGATTIERFDAETNAWVPVFASTVRDVPPGGAVELRARLQVPDRAKAEQLPLSIVVYDRNESDERFVRSTPAAIEVRGDVRPDPIVATLVAPKVTRAGLGIELGALPATVTPGASVTLEMTIDNTTDIVRRFDARVEGGSAASSWVDEGSRIELWDPRSEQWAPFGVDVPAGGLVRARATLTVPFNAEGAAIDFRVVAWDERESDERFVRSEPVWIPLG